VIRVDASDGRIAGVGAEYTFVMPKSWQNGSVTVKRERPNRNSQLVDNLIFEYIPIDRISMPSVFATLYVYENQADFTPPGARKILETDKYIFMFESPSHNNFTDSADQLIFGQYLLTAASDPMMANQIEVPPAQRRIPNNTITVNGRLLRNQALRSEGGTIYIPIRETCNALGYSVSWNAASREVTIHSSDRRHAIPINLSPTLGQNFYSTIIIDNRAYITSGFFMRALNASIEIDGRNNVVIIAAMG